MVWTVGNRSIQISKALNAEAGKKGDLEKREEGFLQGDKDSYKGEREEMLRKSDSSTDVGLIDAEGIVIRGSSANAVRGAVERRRGL